MNPNVVIGNETDPDVGAMTDVTVAAFEALEISNQQVIIGALRAAKALTPSLVAGLADRVIGHIAVSPVTIPDDIPSCYGLGPVSVWHEYRRQGMGKALGGRLTAAAEPKR